MADYPETLSERAGVLAARATQTFGDAKTALKWLLEPLGILGDRAPIDLIHTDAGMERIIAVLGRIDHGVYT